MVSGTLRAKGRHARPAAAEAAIVEAAAGLARGLVRRAGNAVAGAPWPGSRRSRLMLAGAIGLAGLVAAALGTIMWSSGPGVAPKAVAANVVARRPVLAAPSRPARSARRGDPAALAFFARRDPMRAKHVGQVVWTGEMLRVYTDLPASEADSRTAVALCETAVAYAEAQNRIPAVFVHANRAAGYPVLANKMDTRDDCRLGRVP